MARNDSNPSPGADRDENSGRFTVTYPPGEFVEAIRNEGGEAGTKAVAERVGCSYETAYKKLRALEEAGTLEPRKVGNAYLWVVEDG